MNKSLAFLLCFLSYASVTFGETYTVTWSDTTLLGAVRPIVIQETPYAGGPSYRQVGAVNMAAGVATVTFTDTASWDNYGTYYRARYTLGGTNYDSPIQQHGGWYTPATRASSHTFAIPFGPVTPIPNTYSTTNTTSEAIVFEYVDGSGKIVVTLQPGEILNVGSTNAFTLNQIVGNIAGVGEFATWVYKTNQVATYAGGSTGAANVLPLPVPPTYASPTNTPVFNAPANDAQRAANATVNEIRNAADGTKDVLGGIQSELKKLNAKDLSTNMPPMNGSQSNYAISSIQGQATSISNSLGGAIQTAGTTLSGDVATFLAVPTASATALTVPMGALSISVDPFSNTGFATAAAIVRAIIIFFVKFMLLKQLFKLWRECMWRIVTSTATATTSGWLQAAVLSIPQLFTTLAGTGLRYAVVSGIVTLTFGFFSVWLTFTGYTLNLGSLVSGLGSSGQIGFAWFLQFMPLSTIVSAFGVFITAVIGMTVVTITGIAVNDTIGKA